MIVSQQFDALLLELQKSAAEKKETARLAAIKAKRAEALRMDSIMRDDARCIHQMFRGMTVRKLVNRHVCYASPSERLKRMLA